MIHNVILYTDINFVTFELTESIRVRGPERPPVQGTFETSPNMKYGCHRHQNGMDYPCDVIFKMASVKLVKLHFRLNAASRIDRDEILLFTLLLLR